MQDHKIKKYLKHSKKTLEYYWRPCRLPDALLRAETMVKKLGILTLILTTADYFSIC